MKFKYIVKNTAWEAGKTATFMPKPIFGDNGSGMHCHQSLWSNGDPLFYDSPATAACRTSPAGTSAACSSRPSLLAFTNPTVNSYHRLVPGFEAPVNLVYSQRNRSACIRIPITGSNPKAKRIEFRCPDPSPTRTWPSRPSCWPASTASATRSSPRTRSTRTCTSCRRRNASVNQVPTSLPAVIDSLEADHEFLLEGDVFTSDLIETWIDFKRENEIAPIQLRPHPHEFELYYDV